MNISSKRGTPIRAWHNQHGVWEHIPWWDQDIFGSLIECSLACKRAGGWRIGVVVPGRLYTVTWIAKEQFPGEMNHLWSIEYEEDQKEV